MDKKIIDFDDTEKCKFYQHKSPISINHVDINEIVVSISFLLVKKILNILLVTKRVSYAYIF